MACGARSLKPLSAVSGYTEHVPSVDMAMEMDRVFPGHDISQRGALGFLVSFCH
jgi:hypothetical protein